MTPNLPTVARATRAFWLTRNASEGDVEQPARRRELDGRFIAIVIAAAFALGLVWALATGAEQGVWRNVGVVPMGGLFEDLYPFVAAQQTLEAGRDIYTGMEVERWGRPYNYPVLWLTFMRYPEAAIPFLGAGMILAWCWALGMACGRLTVRQGWIVGTLCCSPVVVLALERANTDLIIFCLVVASVALLSRGRTKAAWAGLIVATTLKLFPLFSFGCFLRLGWRRTWPWLVSAGIATAIFSWLQFEQMQGVLRETPKGGIFSYGAAVWVDVVNIMFQNRSGIVGQFDAYRGISTLCAGLLVATTFVAGVRHRPIASGPDPVDVSLDYFRAGSGIFLATFVMGTHFVYRLIFLLLCVPWLTRRRDNAALVWGRHACLGLIVLGMWSNPYWSQNLYFVREIVLWSVAGVLAWLMGRTLPADLRLGRGPSVRSSSHVTSPAG